MPRKPKHVPLTISAEDRRRLEEIAGSRADSAGRVARARVLLAWAPDKSPMKIARETKTTENRAKRAIDKAVRYGPLAALNDLPRKGRLPRITREARAWVVALACRKPKDIGYSYELWTTALLAQHARKHCKTEGHPSLVALARGTVSKILAKGEVRPHKITYYLERCWRRTASAETRRRGGQDPP